MPLNTLKPRIWVSHNPNALSPSTALSVCLALVGQDASPRRRAADTTDTQRETEKQSYIYDKNFDPSPAPPDTNLVTYTLTRIKDFAIQTASDPYPMYPWSRSRRKTTRTYGCPVPDWDRRQWVIESCPVVQKGWYSAAGDADPLRTVACSLIQMARNSEVSGSNPGWVGCLSLGLSFTVFQTVNRHGVCSAVYGTVHYK